ncbi:MULTISPECIES: hypothetical protein [unclassified Frondihabitans]|uniref:hypothetical protein n=1 Tax=unclassified Frondihabitans TaxID=2626248 RepID=UPI000F4D4971|nr:MULTISPECIES: hypothetical protein [unclassified Frondihabitans]RPE78084.1 hypothetical protein EDF37_0753 [Frondihabitans sp. PhB153]RPF08364.1 hypothetical protein EDF39_0754 [Frondihabitans sp. PhB161]
MDKTTRAVLTVILTLFGATFFILGVILLVARHSYLLGAIEVATGALWLIGVIVIRRRAPRV